MKKIKLVTVERCQTISQAEVAVITNSGEEYRHSVDWARGTPQNPVTAEDMKKKFLSLAELVIPREDAEQAFEMVTSFDQLSEHEVDDLISLCSNLQHPENVI
jgi:2-methylcitrate dehydratase PrpD